MKYIHRVEDIPTSEHWAIVEDEAIHVPGDERSRTAPGHGYPEHTEHVIKYEVYESEDEMKTELIKRANSSERYHMVYSGRGMHVIKTFRTTAVVQIETESK